jgi:tRNA nucleotidyltransferase/poly(A) polymerase
MASRPEGGEHPLAGRWFARVGNSIVAVGGSPDQVFISARASRTKEKIILSHIPRGENMPFPTILNQIGRILENTPAVYLVGGAVRDALLGETGSDLDLVVFSDAQTIARRLANELRADIYTLDTERQAYRLILRREEQGPLYIDITRGRGHSLDEDLAARDFSINAIAVDIQMPQRLIDPLGGAQELAAKKLIACGPAALRTDPVRCVRAARLAAQLKLQIEKETLEQITSARIHLKDVSPERRRDEVMKGLLYEPAVFFRLLRMLGVAGELSPALRLDAAAWEDRLARLRLLERLLALFKEKGSREQNIWSGVITAELGDCGQYLVEAAAQRLQQDRERRALWAAACLAGRELETLDTLAGDLVLTNSERQVLDGAARGMGWLRKYTASGQNLDRREIYRYFRTAGAGGLDGIVIWLVDAFLREDGHLVDAPPVAQLRVSRRLLEAWRMEQETIISPQPLIDGHDAQRLLGIAPGAELGRLLEALREEQAVGVIKNRAEAEAWAREWWQRERMG